MMKRTAALLAAWILLLGSLAVPAYARETSPETKIVSAYYQEGTLYTVFTMPEAQQEAVANAEVIVNGSTVATQVSLGAVSRQTPVHYLFLVDGSKKMPGDTQTMLCGLAQGLVERSRQTVTFGLASIGEKLTMVEQNMTTIQQVRAAVWALNFQAPTVNLCGGVSEAIAQLRAAQRPAGGIVNLVLVTNGAGDQNNASAAQLLKTLIQKSPEVILHTLSLGAWDSETFQAVSTGAGTSLRVKDVEEAYAAGKDLAGYHSELYMLQCPITLAPQTDSFSLQLSYTKEDGEPERLIVPSVPNLDIKPVGETLPEVAPLPAVPEEVLPTQPIQPPSEPAEETVPAVPTLPELMEEVPPAEAEAMPATTEPPADAEESTGTEETLEAAALEQASEAPEIQEEPSGSPVWWYILGGAGVLVILVLAVVLRKQKKQPRAMASGIPMELQVIKGKCRTKDKRLLLQQELLVGSDSSCDIIWKDASVSPRHCRIFLKDGFIWLEDLNDRSNTSVEGLKIYAPNRLRSEDEITIGDVQFKLLF